MFATALVPEIDVTAGHLCDLNGGPFRDRKRTKGIPDFNHRAAMETTLPGNLGADERRGTRIRKTLFYLRPSVFIGG